MIPVIFLFLVFFQIVSSDEKNELIDPLELETLYFQRLLKLSRPRRVPGNYCGKRLTPFVYETCGAACTPGSDMDISTICCSLSCTKELVRKACCPEKR